MSERVIVQNSFFFFFLPLVGNTFLFQVWVFGGLLPDWWTVGERKCWVTLTRYEDLAVVSARACVWLDWVLMLPDVWKCEKCTCVQTFITLPPKPWRGTACTLDTLFLSVIIQLDELQWKQCEGHDGNLFTHFHILEAVGLTSVYCCGGKPLSTFLRADGKTILSI